MNMMDMFNPEMVKKIQESMAQTQEKLRKIQVVGESGGGIVKITLNGEYECIDVFLDPVAVDPRDVAMVQTLVKSAYYAAWNKLKNEVTAQSLPNILGNLPNFFKNMS